jgi:hypothetical protein
MQKLDSLKNIVITLVVVAAIISTAVYLVHINGLC